MSAVDQNLLDLLINARIEWLNPVVIAFTLATGPTLMWCYSLVVGFLQKSAFLPILVGAANLLSHLLKKLVERPRPDATHHLVEETNFSMPSGHAVGAAAFAMALTLTIQKWWVVTVWVLALLVGLSRLYVGVHWPSDLLAGWAVGAITVVVSYAAFKALPARTATGSGKATAKRRA